ncbi:threonine aldolase family protein [Nannocystis bainbridge]|uniref:Aminotransferase class I/II-fold pyridoxal phosphate-dependent enzyme n=1 Tax=Nannocystis bainbridge TaxID=2995303 RepID=A0ABT5E9N7_9BACT|nr:aminotransferase class I/II-fold pyridoxal phosphate-dependent enzyme [Nannocystis bainbridge]MDC0722576.1 aminotransferase class I/II-fold pyridoxal phosphate-dependent enzyme [Nannocystis bainbridge]
MTNFRSDNNAGLIPEALAALVEAAQGEALAYGGDEVTQRAATRVAALFGAESKAAVFFVATGTAANTLAVAALTEPWQRVLCHRHSHYNEDESTAPERITQCRTTPIDPGPDPTRLTPEVLLPHLVGRRGDVHEPAPGVLTLSNPTEFGTVYTPAELAALSRVAHEHGYRVHVDGARFSQAVAHVMRTLDLSEEAACRALTVDAGVDALSFGGTKGGLAIGEAVVLFAGRSPAAARAAERLPFLRKSTGHLLSKHRYVSGQFNRALAHGAWVRHAAAAATMAERLAAGLRIRGLTPTFPRESNAVFVDLPAPVDRRLRNRGHSYYPFATPLGPRARLMCSFATTQADIDAFLADIPPP